MRLPFGAADALLTLDDSLAARYPDHADERLRVEGGAGKLQ